MIFMGDDDKGFTNLENELLKITKSKGMGMNLVAQVLSTGNSLG